MLSRKHYEVIANTIRQSIDEAKRSKRDDCEGRVLNALEDVAEGLAAYFMTDNPAFRRTQFLDRCGLGIERAQG
jgi:hypothetical protein